MMRFTSSHLAICLAIAVFFIIPATLDTPLPFLEELQLKSVDARFKIRGGRKPSGDVVIAGIEQRSIDAYGRWPWPRSVLATLIVQLKEYGAKTIVFDLLFPEPEVNAVADIMASLSTSYKELELLNEEFASQIFFDEMAQIKAQSDNDALMAHAVDWSGNIVLGMAFEPGTAMPRPSEIMDVVTAKALYSIPETKSSLPAPTKKTHMLREKMLLPIPALAQGAAALGYANIFPDRDGLIRRARAVIFNENRPFMPMSVAAAGHFLEAKPRRRGAHRMEVGTRNISVDDSGNIHLDFYGVENAFSLFSIADIIDGRLPPEELKDKVVIIGGTATGLGDIWPTPLSSEIPGVFIQATLLDNILQNRTMKIPENQRWIEILTILFMTLPPLLLNALLSPLMFSFTGILALGAYAGVSQYLFTSHQLIWPVIMPMGAGITTGLALIVYNFIVEARQHRWIKKSFSHYLSPDVIDILVKEPEQLSLGGEEKELTVILIDIRNFTTLSEGLAPQELTRVLNLYLGEMTNVILDHGGTLDKYMGDAIMAFFGAPLHDAHHASSACTTTLALCEHLRRKRKEWVKEGVPFLKIGIGINTGKMVVGNLGSQRRFDYSIIGDNVNLGSRLEGLSKVYGVKTIISEYTKKRLGSAFTCRELDRVRVKGKDKPVCIYELMEPDTFTDGTYAFMKSFEKGLACYRSQSFSKARHYFEKTLSLKPKDAPSQLFLKRCYSLEKEELARNWDGTWTFSQK